MKKLVNIVKKHQIILRVISILVLIVTTALFTHCGNPNDAYVASSDVSSMENEDGPRSKPNPQLDYGCKDSRYLEYDPKATYEDHSLCVTPRPSINVCLDTTATNTYTLANGSVPQMNQEYLINGIYQTFSHAASECSYDTCNQLSLERFYVYSMGGQVATLRARTSIQANGSLDLYLGSDTSVDPIQSIEVNSLEKDHMIKVNSLAPGQKYTAIYTAQLGENCQLQPSTITFDYFKQEPNLECLDAPENNPNLQQLTFVAGSKDNLSGVEDGGQFAPSVDFAKFSNRPGTRLALFDESSSVNKETLAEFDLSAYQGDIVCVSAKVVARDEQDMLFHTDFIQFFSSPYGVPFQMSNTQSLWADLNDYPNTSVFTKKMNRDTVDYVDNNIFIETIQLTDHIDEDGVPFLNSLNQEGTIKFRYNDDATVDYVEIMIYVDQ